MLQKPSIYLPSELLEQIFQYLPLEDYPNISRSNKRFYSLVRQSFIHWSRSLLARTLNPFTDDQSYLRSLVPVSFVKQSLFEDDLEPQQILRDRSNIQKEWNLFAGNYLPANQQDNLVKELICVLRNPTPPFPCLKRDTQCFKTNSIFQNFLTEVYFELTKRCYLKDKRSMMIEIIVENFKTLFSDSEKNIEDLGNLRWTLFNTEIETDRRFESGLNLKSLEETAAIQENSIHKRKTNKSRQFKLKKYRQKRRIVANGSKVPESPIEKELSMIHERTNDVSKLFGLIYLLAQNHCQMVRSYIASIQEPATLLNEYKSLWETYVMAIINFDEIFTSLSEYAGQVYDAKFDNANEKSCPLSKFPIWKLMIKAWTTEVFLPLATCLAKILCSISYDLRNKKQNDNKSEGEKVVRLVQEVYNAISDLSYTETTIFFSECALTNPQTPKRLFDGKILKNIMQLYPKDDLFIRYDSNTLKNIFDDDVRFIKELFGRELKYQVLDLQASLLKNRLLDVLNATCDVEETPMNLLNSRIINFKKVCSVLEICNQVGKSKLHQAKMSEEILKECPLFEDFVDLTLHLKEALQVEDYKSKQRAMMLLQKGFYFTQEEIYPFQARNKNLGMIKVQ